MTDIVRMERDYFEVMGFLDRCGQGYARLDDRTCRNFIGALADGRCLISRNSEGEIVRVTVLWLVRPEDVETVKGGGTPTEINSGTFLYVAESAGIDGMTGMIRLVEQLRREYGRIATAFGWHKWNGGDWLWRYFTVRGVNHETV